jgi:hypothetical protein
MQACAKLALENGKQIFMNICIFMIQANTYADFVQLDKIPEANIINYGLFAVIYRT